MRRSFGIGGALVVALASAAVQSCSSSSGGGASGSDAGSDAGDAGRILACPPATDASIAEAADAGLVVKIESPTQGQRFKTTDKVPFKGSGVDPEEGAITDPTRTIWNIGSVTRGFNPDGEGPEDTGGPYPAGSYTVRFDVSNKKCVTGAASVDIVVE